MTLASETSFLAYVQPMACKHCASLYVVKHGSTQKKKQRYYCRVCERTFLGNEAPPGMRFEADVIATTLNRFYEGASGGEIRRYVSLAHGVLPDYSTIHRWVMRYTRFAAICVGDSVPLVKHEWIALRSEPPLNLAGGRATAILDIVDLATGFLIDTRLCFGSTYGAPLQIFKTAVEKSRCSPTRVLTNSSDFQFLSGEQIVSLSEVNRVRAGFANRVKVLNKLVSPEIAHLVLSGWSIHYNYFRPHYGLNGKTPAAAAGIDVPVSSWSDVIARSAKQ